MSIYVIHQWPEVRLCWDRVTPPVQPSPDTAAEPRGTRSSSLQWVKKRRAPRKCCQNWWFIMIDWFDVCLYNIYICLCMMWWDGNFTFNDLTYSQIFGTFGSNYNMGWLVSEVCKVPLATRRDDLFSENRRAWCESWLVLPWSKCDIMRYHHACNLQ